MKDYYKVLGVSRDAANEDIDAAYRRMALKYHPDAGDVDNVDKFKEAAEAHEVLGDSAKRSRYDRQAFAGHF